MNQNQIYDLMRHFADSWGLVYMFAIFVGVAVLIALPGARERALDAASIPLRDDHPASGE